ncbi:FAD-dependent oxidoreductase [Kibdelosporangium banguiense]|uniref:FAD-dependent oxidoreductase n=1 Tax=Kibdelosporangium banguiense TaxID=1365924 RepID=UPI0027DE9C42|nr:FAD-dependent oxidoreductase [Kibdelosporangium banguiense]
MVEGKWGMNTDVVVIGAGVVGTSVVLELSRSGYRVVVVDKAAGVGNGSTSASSAVVRFNFSTAAGVESAWESRACWESWREHLELAAGHAGRPDLRYRRGEVLAAEADRRRCVLGACRGKSWCGVHTGRWLRRRSPARRPEPRDFTVGLRSMRQEVHQVTAPKAL